MDWDNGGDCGGIDYNGVSREGKVNGFNFFSV